MSRTFRVFSETLSHLKESRSAPQNTGRIKTSWAERVLETLNVDLEIRGEVTKNSSVMFVGNHLSYLDIPLLMAAAQDLSFVAKAEVARWPVFGAAAHRIETVFVQRKNARSRGQARRSVLDALKRGQRVALFPSGTTCLYEERPWRIGAFEIAAESKCVVQPFRLVYTPLRRVAYIERDFFPWHLFQVSRLQKISATLEFHSPVQIERPAEECERWHHWSRGLLDEGTN